MKITLSSTEAQTLYNTGRLIRTADCDWQPPECATSVRVKHSPVLGWSCNYSTGGMQPTGGIGVALAPPLEVGAVYDVRIVSPPNLNIPVSVNRPAGFQATPTYNLIFEEGKLRWYEELKRV